MSRLRKAMFTRTNASSHRRGSAYHLLFLSIIPPHLLGRAANLHDVFHHGVVAVPLDKVGATHECAMLGGPSIVVPQVKVSEVDRVLEGPAFEDTVLAQPIDDVLCRLGLVIGRNDHG